MGRHSIHLAYACAMLAAMATTAARAQTPEDTAMAQHIASSIQKSGQISNYELGVKYQDGVAWLLGKVTDKQQQQTAVELARGVEGVEQVICRLEVQSEEDSLVTPAFQQVAESETPDRQEKFASTPFEPAALSSAPAPARTAQATSPAPMQRVARQMPRPVSRRQANAIRTAGKQGHPMPASYCSPGYGGGGMGAGMGMGPQPSGYVPGGGGYGVSYDNAQMPNYAWPSYAAYPNYSALTYPKQYSPTAWPYIGPFYPYPQVPLGWRKVCLEWDDGWWMLDFSHCKTQ